MESTVKLNGVRPKMIKLQLFPFSPRDVAATWFESLPYGSVNNWDLHEHIFPSYPHVRNKRGNHSVQTRRG